MRLFFFVFALSSSLHALDLHLPTGNEALLKGDGAGYFQFVDRNFEGQQTTPWEGGQFGFWRDPRRVDSSIAYARFHEGLDVKPLMTASPRYWGERSYLDDLPVAGEGDTKPPVYLAASVERGAVQDERLRVDSARLVVVGNATLLDAQTRVPVNQDFLAGSVNWMLNRERLIGITPKRKHQYRVQLTDRQRELVFWITTLLAPAVVLGIGFSVWAKRRAL
jgi:hypothetical protein